jgi:ParB family chromosome partitioning protein
MAQRKPADPTPIVEPLLVRYACDHEIPWKPETGPIEVARTRPCKSCAKMARMVVQLRNAERHLPPLLTGRASGDQLMLAELVRDRFYRSLADELAILQGSGPSAAFNAKRDTGAADLTRACPVWWIRNHADPETDYLLETPADRDLLQGLKAARENVGANLVAITRELLRQVKSAASAAEVARVFGPAKEEAPAVPAAPPSAASAPAPAEIPAAETPVPMKLSESQKERIRRKVEKQAEAALAHVMNDPAVAAAIQANVPAEVERRAAVAATPEGYCLLPLDKIGSSALNPRRDFDPEGIAELAASILEHGLLQPMVVRPTGRGGYSLLMGERRYRACKKAGLASAPCIIRQAETDQEAMTLILLENLQRQDLNPIEEAEGFRQLLRFGASQSELARTLHKSPAYVNTALRLLEIPDPVQRMVAKGAVAAGFAWRLAGGDLTDAERTEYAKSHADGRMTVRDLEAVLRAAKIRAEAKTIAQAPAVEAVRRHVESSWEPTGTGPSCVGQPEAPGSSLAEPQLLGPRKAPVVPPAPLPRRAPATRAEREAAVAAEGEQERETRARRQTAQDRRREEAAVLMGKIAARRQAGVANDARAIAVIAQDRLLTLPTPQLAQILREADLEALVPLCDPSEPAWSVRGMLEALAKLKPARLLALLTGVVLSRELSDYVDLGGRPERVEFYVAE